ncbi:MAG: glycosyltransferase family 2 protein [Proteobacteria bacterium]|nr:glycosyltransferase family 2 protein [Pseudomonadota bacterium]
MAKLSFTCIGYNEEQHIRQLLPKLLEYGDEVVYVDAESDDNSFDVAQTMGCRTFSRPNNPNLNVNKSFGIDQTSCEWIFYIDPDERLPEELLAEIRNVVDSNPVENGYKLARRNHFFGQWLKYGGQYPDIQTRLFRKGCARFDNLHVHEKLRIDGKIGKLKHDMHHHPYLDISQYLSKFDFYSTFEANFLSNNKVRLSFKNHYYYLVHKPFNRFFRRFVIKRGYKDGIPGFFAAAFDAAGWMTRYIKLWEIENGRNLLIDNDRISS